VALDEKVENGKLYYSLSRDNERIKLRIINAYGNAIFARSHTLAIYMVKLDRVDGDVHASWPQFNSAVISGTYKGPAAYTRLAYDHHEDGSICGWQITPCGTMPYTSNNPDDGITIEAKVDVFFGDTNKEKTLVIKCETKVRDIPLEKEPSPQPAEQAGAGQPATSPVVEPEGGDKPQPEAEGGSR
jgi:hypothetical protein